MFHHFLISRGLASFGRVYSGFQRRAVGAVKLHSSPDTQAIKRKRQHNLQQSRAALQPPERGVKQTNPAAQISADTEGNSLIAPDCLLMLPQLHKLQMGIVCFFPGKAYIVWAAMQSVSDVTYSRCISDVMRVQLP